jgi:hypothetical protein
MRKNIALYSLIALVILACTLPALAQSNPQLAEKLAALKQSAAQNQQRLHHYQWIETQQLTLKGEPKPPKQFLCQYGPDGQVEKTPIAQQGEQQRQGGALKRRMVQKKTEELQDYMGDVKGILAMYMPPDPQKMQQDFQQGNASIGPGSAPGTANLKFLNYALPGDEMNILFNTQKKKMASVNVKTYLQEPKNAVTMTTQFATLPDGTSFPQQTVLNATAKEMVVTTTNGNYQKLQ